MEKNQKFFLIFLIFSKRPKNEKNQKNQKNEKNPGPWVSPRGGFLAVGIPPSRILSGSRLEPWLEPLTLPAGAPWIFLIFFIFLIFLIFFEKPKK